MPQLHFTVDEQTAKRLQREAKKRGLSVSKYLSTIIARDVGGAWPTGYLDTVIGSCAGSALVEPPDLNLDDVDIATR